MTAPGDGGPIPRCYRHPGREALVRCTRCDRPICPDCQRSASVGFHCPDDVDRGARSVRQPRTGVGALIRQSPPYVTGTLLALNIAAYLVCGTQAPATLQDPRGSRLFADGVLAPTAVHDGEYYRLLTSMFLHLGLLHLAVNMLSLVLIGPTLEALFGRWRFLAVYLVAGLGGSAAVYAFGNQVNATVGASGALLGLLGAALLLARRLGLDLQVLVGTLVLNLVLTFSIDGISRLAHIGGIVAGALCGLALGGLPRRRGPVPDCAQSVRLGLVLAAAVVITAVRSATW